MGLFDGIRKLDLGEIKDKAADLAAKHDAEKLKDAVDALGDRSGHAGK